MLKNIAFCAHVARIQLFVFPKQHKMVDRCQRYTSIKWEVYKQQEISVKHLEDVDFVTDALNYNLNKFNIINYDIVYIFLFFMLRMLRKYFSFLHVFCMIYSKTVFNVGTKLCFVLKMLFLTQLYFCDENGGEIVI